MSFLASDVMNSARIFLNDTGAVLYTNTVLVPYVAKANEILETLLVSYGISVQRVKTSAITVTASPTTESNLTLPSDFLLPIDIYERPVNGTLPDYTQVIEKDWEPNIVPVNVLNYYAFRNNKIYFPPCTVDREVQLRYERQLAVISGENSPEDFVLSKNYLSAKTAELAARYIGMNGTHADDIQVREVATAEYMLMQIYVQNGQALPKRRKRFQTRRLTVQ